MTQEQKAEAYDKALDAVKNLREMNPSVEGIQNWVNENFPELKESEGEKIRKDLIKWFEEFPDMIWRNHCCRYSHYKKDIIAWLEKQGKKELENYDEAEKEKADFVGDGFIECHADFLDFKEGETYWLEYIGDDKYNVRSDNLLGKTYHITPCQLYTVFKKLTWLEYGEKNPTDKVEPTDYNSIDPHFSKPIDKVEPMFNIGDTIVEKDLDECGYGTIKDIKDGQYIFTDGSGMNINEQNGWQLVKTSTNIKQKPAWSEEDKRCEGCNNAKGCVACVDGSEWAHIEESYLE